MKKGFLVMLALTLFLSLGFGQVADAAKRGGFKSPKQSVTDTKKSDNVSQTNPGTRTGATTGATKSGGSSLMKGLMIGGLAGLLFGGMFANMGAMGEIFGLLINLLAIFAIIMLIRVAFVYLKSKKNQNNNPDSRRPY
ncbi:hypothetical protein [Paenibacillus soyae]|uniref:Preprotein translocase subunit Tim44 n=1 Tax=Paenibacillus soyae TaxID=2969249 RepID=A0A9X2MS08_9BACL|nr:hypothetical protein [Paenibacillus soyae]MCR2802917.1 hypothetical protein [Paenibacillus soyae]